MREHNPTLGLACLILAVVLILMYIIATPSRSQSAPPQMPCIPKLALDQQIAKRYGESILGAGVTPMGILYITVNPITGTFTVVMRRPDGMACIVGGGKGWATTETVLPGTNL